MSRLVPRPPTELLVGSCGQGRAPWVPFLGPVSAAPGQLPSSLLPAWLLKAFGLAAPTAWDPPTLEGLKPLTYQGPREGWSQPPARVPLCAPVLKAQRLYCPGVATLASPECGVSSGGST